MTPLSGVMELSECISIQSWAFYLIAGALFAGIAIGFALRVAIDYAELATYRRIARDHQRTRP